MNRTDYLDRCRVCGKTLHSHSLEELVGCASHMIGLIKLVFEP